MTALADNPELDGSRAGAFLATAMLIRARSVSPNERADFIERAQERIPGAVEIGCWAMIKNGCDAQQVSIYRAAAIAAAKLRFSLDQVRGWGIA